MSEAKLFTQAELDAIVDERVKRAKTKHEVELEAIRDEVVKAPEGAADYEGAADKVTAEVERLKAELAEVEKESKPIIAKSQLLKAGYSDDQAERYSKFIVGGSITVDELKTDIKPKGSKGGNSNHADPGQKHNKGSVWNPFS